MRAPSRPRILLLSGVVFAAVVGVLALAMAAQRRPAGPAEHAVAARAGSAAGLPALFRLPGFSFRDQNDRTRTNGDLRGHVVVADFVFTRCTSICPLITAKLALLQRRLPDRELRFVSFSVDPQRDTPEALKRYATEWRPDETRWILLATTPKELERVASALYFSIEPAPNDIAHTNLFFLIDGEGVVRGIYESDRNDALERLENDARTLLGKATATPDSKRDPTGRGLYAALACGACHARKELAPPLEGLAGRRMTLADGAELTADAAYLRESILKPEAKLVPGYALRMPSYAGELTEAELDALVEHVATLGVGEPSPAPASSSAAVLATDPVCSMSVRVVPTTPQASHAGKSYYFCSDACRERFVADPARYVKR